MLRSGNEECSEFITPLEEVFPEENIISSKTDKDIFGF
jgi:hypothetical protein